MKRQLIWMACGGMTALALAAGCSAAPAEPKPGRAAASPAASAGRAEAPRSSQAAVAEHVKTILEDRLSPGETRFGSGTGSPCSTSSAGMFTAECVSAAEATGADASIALEQIGRHEGFATLRSVAEKLRTAVARYQRLGCAGNPAKASTRHACLEPAALIAQGFPDLRSGADLGLRGA
ncbi:hypothetical protein [Streptomyces glomeratus]|uniref:hypothetical protein n=1 Tax=Streptomyces glomeratus TaxID=284452 RepID=UPI001F40E935|nr:hypothetical protein [Streptomyces glomeratus]MCF1508125.1 hypothetical protein [Streptomyces glomeratus]